MLTNVYNCLEALRSNFAAAAVDPTSPTPVEGQLQTDTTNNLLKIYDGATWITIARYATSLSAAAILADGTVTFTADQPMGSHKLTGLSAGSAAGHSVRYDEWNTSRVLLWSAYFSEGFSVTKRYRLGVALTAMTIQAVSLVSDTSVAANDTNYWTFNLTNTTTAVDYVAKTTKVTGGSAITANVAYSLGTVTGTMPVVNDCIEFKATLTLAGTTITQAAVTIKYIAA